MKTLIWLIGKPGAGKTTVGEILGNSIVGAKHFSFGQLLREIEPNPSLQGYSDESRKKVRETIIGAASTYRVVVVDSNPYSRGFLFIDLMRPHFEVMKVFNLTVTDDVARTRLDGRGRKVLLHDGASEEERIGKFNREIAPVIRECHDAYGVCDIDVSNKTPEQVAAAVNRASSISTE